MGVVAGRPERRLDALREMAESEEARRAGVSLEIGPGSVVPVDPRRALAADLDLRTAWLRDQVGELREAVELLGGNGGPELSALASELIEARDAALRSEIGALRREVAAMVDELAQGLLAPGDYGERSYCLIQTCSRAGGPLPHADAPQALPVRPRCLTALLSRVLLAPEHQFPCLLRAPDLQPPLQRTQLRLARTASLLRTQPPQ